MLDYVLETDDTLPANDDVIHGNVLIKRHSISAVGMV
jgi:hypothetical protein